MLLNIYIYIYMLLNLYIYIYIIKFFNSISDVIIKTIQKNFNNFSYKFYFLIINKKITNL